jgi:hypothetical protein
MKESLIVLLILEPISGEKLTVLKLFYLFILLLLLEEAEGLTPLTS